MQHLLAWCPEMMCGVKTFVVWRRVVCNIKCNLNPTNYINTTTLVMWNLEHTHTHTHKTNGTQLHTHRQSSQRHRQCGKAVRDTGKAESRGEKMDLEGRYEWCCARYICDKVWCGMVCCMMWNVCGLAGLQSVKWCRIVWWRRAYGMRWWHQIAVWCGMSWCDFKCFVVWIRLCGRSYV